MYQFSDSESADSDSGIRYKTDSIRNKDKCVERETSSRRNNDYDRRERRRSRSRSPRHKSKKKHHKKESSSESDERRNRHKDRRKNRKEEPRHRKNEYVKREETSDSRVSESSPTQLRKSQVMGPTLPPHLLQKNTQHISLGDLKEESTVNMSRPTSSETEKTFGPALPSHLKQTVVDDISLDSLPLEDSDCIDLTHSPDATADTQTDHTILPPTEKAKNCFIGPALPPNFSKKTDPQNKTGIEDLGNEPTGPALPPDLNPCDDIPERTIGPSLPLHLRQDLAEEENVAEESDDEVYGPVAPGQTLSKCHVELEERALKMKIDQLDPQDNQQATREEWMLTLPEARGAKFGLGPRSFRAKAGPDLSDRSSWTDTPEDKARKKLKGTEPKVDLQKEAELREIKRRDKEQEAVAKKNKKHKKSLIELHQQKLKDKKESGPSERRPFSRELDLQVNRFDEAQKKAVLKKAQLLDTRFSAGEAKYL